ncbi:hypothetical protein NGC65_00790 [Staphylococcus xylosus]|uniref:hypothetical protein n=1 Tax=Staphylococcus xylosus TaxID=1288 RepID=UPI002DBD3FFD|nr:hypothetical protein [Staphylococcus xylosus]MEB6289378.1 hypothetical protein [Staphylococcus xylosus]MEB7719780.1 hypothetical protein [Staphylococcus xylosus]MEB7812939.1 hypothetical protein [Staphylococcus xylosus]MEB7820958.1 hypothetical protein [Staphylococcus xylosus]MEB7836718.1 hypothetical protein [Staphylococcus xylosus]
MKKLKRQKKTIWLTATIIMLSLLLIGVISINYYQMDKAWLFLSFTGTALSIVLSIIAILITLVDVAGQRQQILDVSESAKILKKSVKKQQKEHIHINETVQNVIDEMLKAHLQIIEDKNRELFNDIVDHSVLKNEEKESIKHDVQNQSSKVIPSFFSETLKEFKLKRELNNDEYTMIEDILKKYNNIFQFYTEDETLKIVMNTTSVLARMSKSSSYPKLENQIRYYLEKINILEKD